MSIIFIGGGARSGKSSEALRLAKERANGAQILFIATATASDEEMAERIRRHKAERDSQFILSEEPNHIDRALSHHPELPVCVVDCLTLWLSNGFDSISESDFHEVCSEAKKRGGDVIFVSNEVGEGIVPMHPVSRAFRDMSGKMNATFASLSNEVISMKFGIAVKIK
jgi:adenosyl cobinamide kinase/adenosyl cobinamide phosphate guanylyltransferase